MTDLDRRAVLGGIAMAGGALASAAAISAPAMLQLSDLKKEGEVACVYHCDFGEEPRYSQMLTNISNHYSVYGADPFALQIVVVAHGAGVKFFLEDLEGTKWKDEASALKTFARVEDLAKNGLAIYLCDITFERLKLDRAKVRKADFVSFVPSGVATVAALQTKGFAYLKVA